MSNFSRFASNSRSMSFGSHQLVSEQSDPALDPLFESSKGGSSGHGRSGGVTSEGRRALRVEDRFLSIEDTLRTLTGTVLDLNDRFDKFEGKFNKLDRMFEEISGSGREFEVHPYPPNLKTNPHTTTPSLHMDQTPTVHSNFSQKLSSPAMKSMTSGHKFMLMGLHMEPEERIRMLTSAFQKYKERRDSKAFEETLQKPNGEFLYVSSTFPSLLATGHQQVQHQMPQASMQSPALQHVFPHAQAQYQLHPGQMQQQEVPLEEVINEVPSGIEEVVAVPAPIPVTAVQMEVVFAPTHKWISRIDSEISNATMKEMEKLFPDEKSAYQSKARVMRLKGSTSLDSIQVIKRFGGSMKNTPEGASFCVLVWDPGIQITPPLTLGQGQFEGVGIDKDPTDT